MMRHDRCAPKATATRGVVLLEALIAMLVCAIGVLGVVGLQATMTRAQTAAAFRGEAAYLAQQLIGLMWSDRANLATYASGDCSGTACDQWKTRLAGQLPHGQATVTVGAGGQVQIEIRWQAPGEAVSRFTTATVVRDS